ncbi:MAG: type II toxin-antitoxin system RelE/ParE family toxin [Candidatus Hydrogenedentes bacterium]|nr:type II toxin-antitoxin system RelE/ParE family toxin [Candidatus Hydrogenedentota bacterium]
MPFKVMLTDDAMRDLEDIYEYVAQRNAPLKADRLVGRMESVFNSLAESPERGAFPKELLALGIREYREVFFKPYRIIYRILNRSVYVLLITDGRRDMQTLLQRRLLES